MLIKTAFYSLHQWTPLHIAAGEGYMNTVKCLAGGTSINIKNSKGVSMT